ncbi:MAG TPA: hypothetical protein VFD39_11035 [Trueperaceae bacterium]|nr:hypothetical protein [Trueperaceae bacterium]
MTNRQLRPLARLSLLAAIVVLTVTACSSPQPPPLPEEDAIAVEGLWLVEPGPGTFYGSGGTTTLEFGSARSGSATFLSRSDASGVLTCERHVYAALTENVLILDGTHYEAQASGDDLIELGTDSESITLTRVTGSPLVEPCLEAEATQLQSFTFGMGSWTTLTSFQSRLYFNTDETGNPVVGYDTATGVLGPKRLYAGSHDHLVAARSDDEFYGHCACGNITSLERFNIGTTPGLATISTTTDLGIFMSVERGAFDGSSLIVSGRDYDNPGVNHVLTLHPDTLALQSQRDVLPETFMRDLAWTGTQLAALVGRSIVLIGADGLAEATIELPAEIVGFPRGLAVIGANFYVLTESDSDEASVHELTLP